MEPYNIYCCKCTETADIKDDAIVIIHGTVL